jgi:hypothetical protein
MTAATAAGRSRTETQWAADRKNVKIVLIMVILVLMALMAGVYFGTSQATLSMQTTHASQVFIDLDGNGQMDLLVSGEVIMNQGPFVPSQSSQTIP